jgi:hypothetical protein
LIGRGGGVEEMAWDEMGRRESVSATIFSLPGGDVQNKL